MRRADNAIPPKPATNEDHTAKVVDPATPVFCVCYVAPDGSETKWGNIEDYDKLKRDEIGKDRERRKGSWFAWQVGKGHFRI